MVDKFYKLLISALEEIDDLTDSKIEEEIAEIRCMPKYSKMSEIEITEVKNRAMANNKIKMNRGSCIENNYEYKKWFLSRKSEINMKYWDSYRKYLLRTKNFSIKVVNTMDSITDSLVDLLGDPLTECDYSRKGLIIGDVQSGKTSNYTGLICKGADVGYKVIVVLTGTIEKLRKQTQMRIDEGFIGRDSDAIMRKRFNTPIGAGKYYSDKSIPIALTSVSNDFKISNAKAMNATIDSFSEPIVFVVKKNVSTLKNLNTWLEIYNREDGEKIEHPLLVIDDESDNASVNTNDEDKNPTSINNQIRTLLSLFYKSSYVGFTATPFANIFINPDTEDEMLEDDLFPKDYIYSLNAPSNYIGARDIFPVDGKHNRMFRVIDIDEINRYLPIKHKKTDILDNIPSDLKLAIRTFIIANVIRDLRGDRKTHRSMLVNVSRFNDIQKQVEEHIVDYLKKIQYFVKVYGKSNEEEVKNYEIMKSLRDTFDAEYNDCEFTWGEIERNLYESIAGIEVKVINQSNGREFDYDNYQDGARIIAVGGLSLSRGLTLEGLIISYFYRNSKMYDTLMQMGRWFGYRDKYSDLCRIWMTEESREWYEYISEATDELRMDIKSYQDSKRTPKDFGIKVRSSMPGLLVTARNKMRTAEYIERPVSLSGTILETVYFYKDENKKNYNINVIDRFTTKLLDKVGNIKRISERANNYMFSNVPSNMITSLISELEISAMNKKFDTDIINAFIEGNKSDLMNWDVVFKSGKSTSSYKINNDIEIEYVERKSGKKFDEEIISLNNNRLGSSADGKLGLFKNQIEEVESRFERNNDNDNITTPQREYFKIKRSPMLIIYMLDIKNIEEKYRNDEKNEITPYVGISIGIPSIDGLETVYYKYAINKIHQQLGEGDYDDYDEDEE